MALLERPFVLETAGIRLSVAALGMLGERGGVVSSGGADDGRPDLRYAETTERSMSASGLTLFPVSTSVSSAPMRASTLRRKGGMREEVRLKDWLLLGGPGEGPGDWEQDEPRLGREKSEPDRWLWRWFLQPSARRCSVQWSSSSGSSQARGRELWEFWTLGRDVDRWQWWRRFLWEAALRVNVDGAEADSGAVGDM